MTARKRRERVGRGKLETANAAVALRRLADKLQSDTLRVSLEETDGKYRALSIYRFGRPNVLYGPKSSLRNLELLAEFAHVGLKMPWTEIKEITGWQGFNT